MIFYFSVVAKEKVHPIEISFSILSPKSGVLTIFRIFQHFAHIQVGIIRDLGVQIKKCFRSFLWTYGEAIYMKEIFSVKSPFKLWSDLSEPKSQLFLVQ